MPRRKKGGEEGIKISSTIYQNIQPFDKTIVNEQIAKKKLHRLKRKMRQDYLFLYILKLCFR